MGINTILRFLLFPSRYIIFWKIFVLSFRIETLVLFVVTWLIINQFKDTGELLVVDTIVGVT